VKAQCRKAGVTFLLSGAGLFVGGCSDKTMEWAKDFFKTDSSRFMAPEKLIRAKAHGHMPISPILPSVSMTDQSQELVPNATFPREGDWTYSAADYIIGPTDILDISILDLFAEGLETTLRRQVSAGGFVDLPLLAQRIKVEGLTAMEVKLAVADAYSPEILLTPQVSVTVAAQRQSTFSALGAIRRPGTYAVTRRDMRLLDALALVGDVSQTNIRYIYIIRPAPARRVVGVEPGAAEGGATPVKVGPLPEIPKDVAPPTTAPATSPAKTAPQPDADAAVKELGEVIPGIAPPTKPAPEPRGETLPRPSLLMRLAESGGVRGPGTTSTAEVDLLKDTRTYKWIYSDGRWIRVAQEAPAATRPAEKPTKPGTPGTPAVPPRGPVVGTAPDPMADEMPDPYGWGQAEAGGRTRIIAINLEKLQSGDPRMNIIIHDNDILHVPVLKVGEFYIMGEVGRPGVYSLTGRRITIKMALAAAGNFNSVAWPKNSLLIRRIGDSQEQVIPLDIAAIFRNEKADVFLKPNDVIAIGTDVRSPFIAVLRNAFRMTYAFGFIYDRNFADPAARVHSDRFTRW